MIKFRNFLNETISIDDKDKVIEFLETLKKIKIAKGSANLSLIRDFTSTKNIKRYKFLRAGIKTLRDKLDKSNFEYDEKLVFLNREGFEFSFSDGSKIQLGASGGEVGSGGNKGNQFEVVFFNELDKFLGNNHADLKYSDALKELDILARTEYKGEIVMAKMMGALNQKREINFDDKVGLKATKLDIGKIVTDITLVLNNDKEMFLSLKVGDAKFLNKGISELIPQKEILSGEITNRYGKAFLETLGINNGYFCDVYQSLLLKEPRKLDIPRIDNFYGNLQALKSLIKGAIGYGYILVKKDGNKVFIKNMTKENLETEVANLRNIKVLYPEVGKKTISITCDTKSFKLAFVIRNRNGGIIPHSIDLNYRTKH